ncbi:DNA polymerase III subunit delta [Patescibacteria group bacterium]|nr:MAG: DNA polymerase III subunit delta [Patescibacteria group bacterium]
MLIFFYGENTFDSQKKLLELKERFLRKDQDGINLVEKEGAELTGADFEKEIATVPFLGGKRLVVIKNLLLENKDKKILAGIEKRFESIPQETVVVFYERGVPDKRLKLFKELRKKAETEEFILPQGYDLNSWIEQEVKKQGGSIQRVALNKLAVFVGNDLWQLHNEIKKLLAYADGEEIKSEDIELLVQAKVDENIFRLTDAFGRKNRKQTLEILGEFLGLGFKSEYLVGMLAGHLRNLIQIKELSEKGFPLNQIQQETKIHPYAIKKSLEQIKFFTLGNLKELYQKLFELDEKIKRGQVKSDVALELLLASA